MAKRNIVHIDQDKCDGCGLCVTACAEGAIQLVDGKAKLVSDIYCDGLGACLGHCPRDAIRIEVRDAAEFDEEKVRKHLAAQGRPFTPQAHASPAPAPHSHGHAGGCPGSAMRSLLGGGAGGGCPGTRLRQMQKKPADVSGACPSVPATADSAPSELTHWPVQLRLVPSSAPFLAGADVLLVGDCVPFACADFHSRFLRGKPVLVACPKLDDSDANIDRLAGVLAEGGVKSVTVVHMEVPCCRGLVHQLKQAAAITGSAVPLRTAVVGINGAVLSEGPLE
jgi:Pyruvate/2-oxoacid:ferredoxin oxidoreductase delta subunit